MKIKTAAKIKKKRNSITNFLMGIPAQDIGWDRDEDPLFRPQNTSAVVQNEFTEVRDFFFSTKSFFT